MLLKFVETLIFNKATFFKSEHGGQHECTGQSVKQSRDPCNTEVLRRQLKKQQKEKQN